MKKVVKQIRDRLATQGQQRQANLADIWSSMARRLSAIYTRYETIESHLAKGQSHNTSIEKRVADLNTLFGRGMTTNELIIGAMAELVSVISDQAEEFSQAQIEMGMMQADLEAQKAEMERAQKATKEGKYDAANLETVAREGELFGYEDVDTVAAWRDKVNLSKLSLADCDPARWQQWQAAFEAAREARKNE